MLTGSGATYLFMLTATNFLGRKSPVLYKRVNRTNDLIPTVTVFAPALTEIRHRRGSASALNYLTLEGGASLPGCSDASNEEVFYSWACTGASATPGLTSTRPDRFRFIDLDLETKDTKNLQVYPDDMVVGVRYTFTLQACLGSDVSLCNTDSADVVLVGTPMTVEIAGGDFAVASSSGFTLDACMSSDPDEPNAPLTFDWRGTLPKTTVDARLTLAPVRLLPTEAFLSTSTSTSHIPLFADNSRPVPRVGRRRAFRDLVRRLMA